MMKTILSCSHTITVLIYSDVHLLTAFLQVGEEVY